MDARKKDPRVLRVFVARKSTEHQTCLSPMPTLSPAFFSMMITTPLPSWSRHHQSTVRGLLRQLTRNDLALADDLAQETFLRVYKNLRSFRGEAKFSTWLYRIAYNVFREDARQRKELVGIDESNWQDEQDPKTVDPALRHDLDACS